MEVNIEDSWKRRLQPEFDKPYFYNLTNFVKEEYSKHTIYPPGKFIFHAFNTCPFDKVKVVIIGQDPYHEPGQYYGLCFSVLDGVPFPPSLLNIFKEIENDLGKPMPESGRLERWADQGVLLINAILTVRAHQAGSHRGKGWEEFTDAVIKILNDEKENIVFMLWGSYAQRKGAFIDRNRHCVLTAAHPSPLSADRGFFGCKHFSKANQYFKSKGISEIEW
ncbi:uracil-DNA glycosylase [Coprobacter fastidiosus]|jgi:uracil-DNA glycosylase|uniref:uracil-DNA glycosylase n=1 Tax=Coprobacter fastidiosus TaxID=1099853 RepID=UPI000EFE3E09|nr:uracil-DNA glycosylase [Coprobacter fastidiosus]RHO59671.1 uracil-DNA glycosylase [Tannerella sp. AM09-19]HJF43346.1 uracil-DNA glycosylase [Coprobacter fastidiosus]